jgi:hypothetical protein
MPFLLFINPRRDLAAREAVALDARQAPRRPPHALAKNGGDDSSRACHALADVFRSQSVVNGAAINRTPIGLQLAGDREQGEAAIMVGTKPLIGAVLAAAFTYGVYPYVTLYRLGQAIRAGDSARLETMVDWPSVREGIKEDICDFVIEEPQQVHEAGKLPPFGAGFVRGIATNAVDKRVTPEALVAAVQDPEAVQTPSSTSVEVSWAFFASPSAFLVDLTAPGQAEPIRLQMDLRDGAWQVTRVWLPPELLGQTKAHT